MPTTEDKLLQRAVAMVLEPIYEQDFLDCSYAFRPGRSAHDALEALWRQSMELGTRWILNVDIAKFFDTWDLHYVLDLWFADEVKPRLRGRAFMIRFADDVVMGFEYQEDAERVLRVLPKRFGRYGLTIHPEKTRLVPFGRPSAHEADQPGTFDFLGFTHYWGKSRRGKWIIKRKTANKRFTRGLKRIAEWCRRNRHQPIAEQHRMLCQKLRGHCAYYGITGNGPWLQKFREEVKKRWQK